MKMNKKVMITVSSVALATVLGFGIYHSNAAQAQPNLSQAEIEELVKAQYPGTINEIELEKGFNKVVYEVEVVSNGKEYEIKLDGNTGEVLKLEEKTISNSTQNSSNLTIKEKDDSKDDSDDNADDKSKENADEKSNEKKVVISSEEAKKIALAQFEGAIKELELDEDDDRLIYEIEIESSNGEAELEIDAYTGEVISLSIDRVISKPENNKVTEEKNTTEKPATNNPVNRDDDDDDDDQYEDDDDDDDDDDDEDDDDDDNEDDDEDDDGDDD